MLGLIQRLAQKRGHLLAGHCVRHENEANPVLLAQQLLQGVPLDLRFERRPTLVHRIWVSSVLHALEFSSHLLCLAPRVELQAPVGGRVAQKGWASFRARQTKQRFEGATHHVLSRLWVRIHQ